MRICADAFTRASQRDHTRNYFQCGGVQCARAALPSDVKTSVALYESNPHMQVNGQRGMDEVFAEIDGVLSAFSEDDMPKAAAV